MESSSETREEDGEWIEVRSKGHRNESRHSVQGTAGGGSKGYPAPPTRPGPGRGGGGVIAVPMETLRQLEREVPEAAWRKREGEGRHPQARKAGGEREVPEAAWRKREGEGRHPQARKAGGEREVPEAAWRKREGEGRHPQARKAAGEAKGKRRGKEAKGEGREGGKKSHSFVLELGTLLEQASKGSKAAVGSAPVAAAKPLPKPLPPDKAAAPRNVLDSSAPMERRGKEREGPKKSKPSPLRKIITREKEERKRLLEESKPKTAEPKEESGPTTKHSSSVATDAASDIDNQTASAQTTGVSSAVPPQTTGVSSAVPPQTKGVSSAVPPQTTGVSSAVPPQTKGVSSAVPPQTKGVSSAVPPQLTGVSSAVSSQTKDFSSAVSPQTKGVSSTLSFQTPVHNRRFREYCTHLVSEDINSCVELLLGDLVRFQDRQYLKDPIRAKAKRRYVCGFREVMKHLKLKRLKCVIIPPNLDRIQSAGGINDQVSAITQHCKDDSLPVVFCMSRRRLAYVLKKPHKVGCVGIFSYDGAEAHYKRLMELVEAATEQYQELVGRKQQLQNDATAESAAMVTESVVMRTEGATIATESEGSSGSEGEDGVACQDRQDEESQVDLADSKWSIFMHPMVQHGDTHTKLLASAKEFVPKTFSSFKFNVNASDFIPFSS